MCKACGRQFVGGQRRDKAQVITDYIEGKQTMEQLAERYKVSSKTIARDLAGMRYVQKISKDKQVVIQMDTTYWGRNFGLLKQLSMRYPVQMCQFHQQMIVRRYLADDPDLDASRDLLDLINGITLTDKESFIGAFDEWHGKYKHVLNERIHDKRLRTPPFMRPRLRSAYLSIKRNMGWLWTFYDYKDRVIPNTNNGLEGIFSDIKSKVGVHSGLSKEHRKRLIDEYLTRHY